MKSNILVVMDRYGVKHIAPYSLIRRKGSAMQEQMMKRKSIPGSFDETLLDELADTELQYQGTENLENWNKELAKTPSTERKGVY